MASASSRSKLDPRQRKRVRRLVRSTFLVVIGIEMLVIALAAIPARAVVIVCTIPCPVTDSALKSIVDGIRDTVGFPGSSGTINGELRTMNRHLRKIQTDQTQIHNREIQHARQLGNSWASNLPAVTSDPTSKIQGLSFADSDPGGALFALVPGAIPWNNYHSEFNASADTTLTVLRTSLDALHEHNKQIENDDALTRISDLADDVGSGGLGGNGFLAMDALEIQSSLEVGRQIHALRAQYAISTSIYAIAESHKTASDARTKVEDEGSNCRRMTQAIAGRVGGIVGSLTC